MELKLSDLIVEGYGASATYNPTKKKWEGGCTGGKFILEKLTPNGTHEVSYYWIDFGKAKDAEGKIGPGWFADDVGTPIDGGADSVKIPAGQGYWTYGSGYKLVIPAPEL